MRFSTDAGAYIDTYGVSSCSNGSFRWHENAADAPMHPTMKLPTTVKTKAPVDIWTPVVGLATGSGVGLAVGLAVGLGPKHAREPAGLGPLHIPLAVAICVTGIGLPGLPMWVTDIVHTTLRDWVPFMHAPIHQRASYTYPPSW